MACLPPPGELPDLGVKPDSLASAGSFVTTEPPGKPLKSYYCFIIKAATQEQTHRWKESTRGGGRVVGLPYPHQELRLPAP